MKVCYVDESGTGDEPYAVMVGVVVDALRMRPTKAYWSELLSNLSRIAGRTIDEFHTRDFYPGNGVWRNLDGPQRSETIDAILAWLKERKHSLVIAAVDKEKFAADFPRDPRYGEVQTIWRFLGLHLILALQKNFQSERKNKGNTILIFDNEDTERVKFTDLISNAPDWTDTYYDRGKKQEKLDQIIDVPYFGDSREVALLQVADLACFFLRRHLEIQSGKVGPRYDGEKEKVAGWASAIFDEALPGSSMFPKRKRCDCAGLFYDYAPELIRAGVQ